MHACSDPACTHSDHSQPPFNHELPVPEEDAWFIDEARRGLLAMVNGEQMAPRPDRIDMTTRQIDVPTGERAMQIQTIRILFREDAPAARGRIRQYLNGRFDAGLSMRRDGRGNQWQFLLMATLKMPFDTLLVTLDSVRGMGPVELVRADGLFEQGMFVIDLPASGAPAFRLIGDRHAH